MTRVVSVAGYNFTRNEQSGSVVDDSGNENIEMLFDYDSGTFISQTIYSTGVDSYSKTVAVTDFNRDSYQDVAVTNNRYDTVNVSFGDGNGTLDTASVHHIGSDSFPSSIGIGDFNQDN